MTGILDNKSHVLLSSKLYASYNIPCASDVDRVARVVTQGARLRSRGERVACLVLEQRGANLAGGEDTKVA